MTLPAYVTTDEVRRVCKELKLRDWTKITVPKISLKEAGIVLKQIDHARLKIDPEQLDITELEGGLFKAVVTRDMKKVRKSYGDVIAARIALAKAEARGL